MRAPRALFAPAVVPALKSWSRSHLADHEVVRTFTAAVVRDCATTAELLADLGELDARRLYVPAGYASMHAYCTGAHHMSEDAAFKRIRVARTARQFPVIFDAVAEGRLNLSGVMLLAACLSAETVDEWIAAASHKPNSEIELLLAERFPRPDVATRVAAIAPPTGLLGVDADASGACQQAARPVGMTSTQQAPGPVDASPARVRVTPLAPGRFDLRTTLSQEAHEDLRCVQDLLGHSVPSGDVAEVIGRALKCYRRELEKRRFAATDRPRPGSRRHAGSSRHIPAAVQRAVWERDGGQCAFVSDSGHHCEARRHIDFDHVEPVARGGEATTANIRLLCSVHNQHAAELAYGKGFMDEKRSEAKRQAAEARAQKAAAVAARARERAAAELAAPGDVIPGLKILGYRGDDLRCAAKLCAAIPGATTEVRMHHVIKALGRASMSRLTHAPRSPV